MQDKLGHSHSNNLHRSDRLVITSSNTVDLKNNVHSTHNSAKHRVLRRSGLVPEVQEAIMNSVDEELASCEYNKNTKAIQNIFTQELIDHKEKTHRHCWADRYWPWTEYQARWKVWDNLPHEIHREYFHQQCGCTLLFLAQ